ncbi:hypothetical protein YWIDRAFT_00840 [Streptomyces sp. SceaMP-e96]|nr:hypothetical protein YWIDRAFT_00840 [Streptomyces sp. SceaMP-e96]
MGWGPGLWWVPVAGPPGWVFGLLRFTSEHPPLRPRPLPPLKDPTPVGVKKNKKPVARPHHDAAELLVFKNPHPHRTGAAIRTGGGGPEGPVLWT